MSVFVEAASASGNRGKQLARVVVSGIGKEFRGRAGLDDPALPHHREPVAYLGGDMQIVCDEQHRQVESFLEGFEKIENLRLDGDVESRNGLVGDQHVGFERQRPGDPDPLPLPARELVRAAAGVARIESDKRQQFPCSRRRGLVAGRRATSAPSPRSTRLCAAD